MSLKSILEAAFSIDVLVFIVSFALYFEFWGNQLIFITIGASILAGIFILAVNYFRRSFNVRRRKT